MHITWFRTGPHRMIESPDTFGAFAALGCLSQSSVRDQYHPKAIIAGVQHSYVLHVPRTTYTLVLAAVIAGEHVQSLVERSFRSCPVG